MKVLLVGGRACDAPIPGLGPVPPNFWLHSLTLASESPESFHQPLSLAAQQVPSPVPRGAWTSMIERTSDGQGFMSLFLVSHTQPLLGSFTHLTGIFCCPPAPVQPWTGHAAITQRDDALPLPLGLPAWLGKQESQSQPGAVRAEMGEMWDRGPREGLTQTCIHGRLLGGGGVCAKT